MACHFFFSIETAIAKNMKGHFKDDLMENHEWKIMNFKPSIQQALKKLLAIIFSIRIKARCSKNEKYDCIAQQRRQRWYTKVVWNKNPIKKLLQITVAMCYLSRVLFTYKNNNNVIIMNEDKFCQENSFKQANENVYK